METRTAGARATMEDVGLDALVVTSPENTRYLSGFSGSSAVCVLTAERALVVTDGRYAEQASRQCSGWEVEVHAGDLMEILARSLSGRSSAGFDTSVSFDFHSRLSAAFPDSVKLSPDGDIVQGLRAVKDSGELEAIRAAVRCAAEAFEAVLPTVTPGATEREIAIELDYRMMLAGADSPAFDTVVASGPGSSMPHAEPGDREIRKGDLVVIDFGARKDGYCSDTSRTLVAGGGASSGKGEVIAAVEAARDAALDVMRPGLPACDADRAARTAMENRGLGGFFSHSLGHGVGLEVHERPTLSSRSNDTLEKGMVFTVEPGAYIEGWGGVRLEEMVLLTDSGPEVLTGSIPHP